MLGSEPLGICGFWVSPSGIPAPPGPHAPSTPRPCLLRGVKFSSHLTSGDFQEGRGTVFAAADGVLHVVGAQEVFT